MRKSEALKTKLLEKTSFGSSASGCRAGLEPIAQAKDINLSAQTNGSDWHMWDASRGALSRPV